MRYLIHSHRNALEVLENVPGYVQLWSELRSVIEAITDERLRAHYESNHQSSGKAVKSLSQSINSLLKEGLLASAWNAESKIFSDPLYSQNRSSAKWRLDFSKNLVLTEDPFHNELEPTVGISVEVAFNNDGSTAWNLIKPVLAGELNHVAKETQTGLGVIITATEELKKVGGFDSAIGTFESFKLHLKPMRDILTVPILLVGLEPMESFRMDVRKTPEGNRGFIVDL